MSTIQPARTSNRTSQNKSTEAASQAETIDAQSVDVNLEAKSDGDKGAALVTLSTPANSGRALTNRPVYDHTPGPLPGNRPITPSKMTFRYSETLPHRPIATNVVQTRPSETLPGNRPIAVGGLQVFKPSNLPGGRPIATNNDGITDQIIGYLD